jgi:hypothetical protein
MTIKKWWKGQHVAIKVAVITGALTICTYFLEEAYNGIKYLAKNRIKIEDIKAVKSNDKLGIDIVVKNLSPEPQVLTSLRIEIGEKVFSPMASLGHSTYSINDDLEVKIINNDSNGVIYKAKCEQQISANGENIIYFSIPIRENIAPTNSESLIFILPDSIRISEIKLRKNFVMKKIGRKYISEGPIPKVKFKNLLINSEELMTVIKINSSAGNAQYEAPLTFK